MPQSQTSPPPTEGDPGDRVHIPSISDLLHGGRRRNGRERPAPEPIQAQASGRGKYIHRIGIEVEGGWDEYVDEIETKGDGSVEVLSEYCGEYASDPMPIEGHTWPRWLRKFYPQETNPTCGLHVHISLTSQYYYQRLMDREYMRYFRRKLFAWGRVASIPQRDEFWKRLRGRNQYCKNQWQPDKMIAGGGDRYAQVNFPWHQHQTVEFRVLPCFASPETSEGAINALLDGVTSYLDGNCRTQERRISVHINEETDEEVITLCV